MMNVCEDVYAYSKRDVIYTDKEPIRVWEYKDAPLLFKQVGSEDDADWLAEVPEEYDPEWIGWMQEGSPFGRCSVDIYDHPLKPKMKIVIGYHA